MRQLMIGIFLCLFAASAAWAQGPSRKPGLWEVTHKMKVDGKDMPKPAMPSLKHLSPEDRAAMEKMMQGRGIAMPTVGPDGAQAVKMCLSQEMADAQEPPMHQSPGAQCTHKFTKRTADTVAFTFTCTGRRASQGQGEAKFESAERYAGWVETRTEEKGHVHTMRMDYSARWLGGHCQQLKPLRMPED